jgi:general secretion pathway protein M
VTRLNKREKVMIYVAAGFIGLFLIFQFGVFPLVDKRERLQRALETKTRAIAEIETLAAEFNNIKNQSDSARKRIAKEKTGFTLFSFLDRVAGQTRLKDRIAYMKPSTATPKNSPFKISTVEMKLQAITLEQLVAYLYKVETSENAVHIKRISLVKAGKNKSLITAIMEIESFKI